MCSKGWALTGKKNQGGPSALDAGQVPVPEGADGPRHPHPVGDRVVAREEGAREAERWGSRPPGADRGARGTVHSVEMVERGMRLMCWLR